MCLANKSDVHVATRFAMLFVKSFSQRSFYTFDHIMHIFIGKFWREGKTYRLPPNTHRVRIVLRVPIKGRAIKRVLGDTQIMDTDADAKLSHDVKEFIPSDLPSFWINENCIEMEGMSRAGFELRRQRNGKIGERFVVLMPNPLPFIPVVLNPT